MKTVQLITIAMMSCGPAATSLDETGPFAGSYNNAEVTFATGYAQIRSGTLTVNFSNQVGDDCRNPTHVGGTVQLIFGIDAPDWVGEFPLQDTLVGATVFATATTYTARADGGYPTMKNQLLTQGAIRIDSVTDGGVAGWGKATASTANFVGNFTVPWCAL